MQRDGDLVQLPGRTRLFAVACGLAALVLLPITLACSSSSSRGARSAVVERIQGAGSCVTPLGPFGLAGAVHKVPGQVDGHCPGRRAPVPDRPLVADELDRPLGTGTTDEMLSLDADHVALLDDSYGVLGP